MHSAFVIRLLPGGVEVLFGSSHTKSGCSVAKKRKLKLAATFFIIRDVAADFSLRETTSKLSDLVLYNIFSRYLHPHYFAGE